MIQRLIVKFLPDSRLAANFSLPLGQPFYVKEMACELPPMGEYITFEIVEQKEFEVRHINVIGKVLYKSWVYPPVQSDANFATVEIHVGP